MMRSCTRAVLARASAASCSGRLVSSRRSVLSSSSWGLRRGLANRPAHEEAAEVPTFEQIEKAESSTPTTKETGQKKEKDKPLSMQVLFLGCGPGRFELEFLSRAPQLVSSSMALSAETTAEQDAAQAIFDSSFIPPTAQADDLRHSWLARGRASHELGSPDDAVPASVDQSSFGASKPQFGRPMPTTRQRNTMQAGQSSSTTMKLPCRIYFNSSVVVYQNCAFCWSPSTFEEITVESLAFLRVMTPRPELVLLGTGNLIPGRIPDSIVAFMRELRIGVELMPSRSAIGTYNMLTNEGRTVMAALLHLVEEKTDPGQRPVRPSQRARQKLGYWNQEATNERKT